MKFSKSVVHALAMGTTAFASRGGDNEWTTIQSRMEPSTVGTQNFYGVKAHKDCNPQPLNPYMLIDKYHLNITDLVHIEALADAVTGKLALGSHNQLIIEANDAVRTGALVVDGLNGDTNFPHGKLKPLITVGEINMCEQNLGDVYTGVPDGMGAYLYDDKTVRIIVQSESYGPVARYETWAYPVNNDAATFTGSHVHYIDYDRKKLSEFIENNEYASEMIKGFGQVATKYYNLKGDPIGPRNKAGPTTIGAHYSNTDVYGNYVITNDWQGEPREPTYADWNMQSLCSAHLEEKHQWGEGIGFEDDLFLTNEEWMTYSDGKSFVGISMHAMGLKDQVDYAVGAVTNSGFEKIVEVNPMHTDYVLVALSGYNGAYSGYSAELEGRIEEYGLRPDGQNYTWTRDLCPTRIYIGAKGYLEDGSIAPEDDFLARNGLKNGKVFGFATDMSTSGSTGGLYRDEFHKNRNNGEELTGKFVAIDWKWDGIVKNFRHDGAWEFQLPVPGYGPNDDFKWWNSNGMDAGGSKTEHASSDNREGVSAFVQTSTAGYFGHYYLNGLKDLFDSLGAGELPTEVDATYYVYQGENDVSSQIELGGAGLYNEVDQCPGVEDATLHCDSSKVRNTFEDIDGFEVIAAEEGLYAVIQEDSGNRLGERMFLTKLEHNADGKELDYFFIAQSGGSSNTRMLNGVGVPPHTNIAPGSHEFSGVIDLSGFVKPSTKMDKKKCKCDCNKECKDKKKKKKDKKKEKKDKKKKDKKDKKKVKRNLQTNQAECDKCKMECDECKAYNDAVKNNNENDFEVSAGNGKAVHEAEFGVSINDKIIALGLQAHNLYMGPVHALNADRGGQVILYAPKNIG